MVHNGSATLAPDSHHPGGITLTQLAEQRGISKDAAAGWSRPARLQRTRRPAATGRSGESTRTIRHPCTTVAPVPDLAELVTLVDRYKAEAQENAVAAAVWQERDGVLADRPRGAKVQILALAAPSGPKQEDQETPDVPELPPPTAASRFRPRLWPLLAFLTVLAGVVVIFLLLVLPRG
jgi:hypothetical protein